MDQLSSLDASFLHLETPETPMHVGSLILLDLPEGYQGDYYEDVKAMLGKRLHLSPILTRKLAQMPFELAEPVWIEDHDIDLDYHIRSIVLRRPGSMDQLEQLVARLHSSLLDRSRPLWEMSVIEGLENGQVAFYLKAHHSGVDGKAGAELAKLLYDHTPQIRDVPPPRRKRASDAYQLGVTELLQAAVNNTAQQYRTLAELLPTAAKAFTTAAGVIASQRSEKGKRALSLGLAPKTIFNESITNQRSYTTMSVPLAEVKALGKRVSGRSLRVNASAGLTNVILRGLRRIGAPDVLAAAEEPSRSFFGAEGSAPELADHLPVAGNPAPGCVRQPVRHGGFR